MKTSFAYFFALVFLAAISARADKLVIVAGGGTETNRAPATKFQLRQPFGVDFDHAGNMFIVEMEAGQRVLKVDLQGLLTIIAGNGQKGNAGDGGPAAQATFNGLHNLAMSPNGDLFLADTFNGRIRKIDAKTGVISTFAGNGTKGFGGDGGPVAKAAFGTIINVVLDPQGANLYLADIDNRRVRKINLASGLVTTVAGNGEKGVAADGAEAKSAPLMSSAPLEYFEMAGCSRRLLVIREEDHPVIHRVHAAKTREVILPLLGGEDEFVSHLLQIQRFNGTPGVFFSSDCNSRPWKPRPHHLAPFRV